MREYLKNQAKPPMMPMLIMVDITYTVFTWSPSRFTSGVAKIGGNGCAETPNIHFINAWKKIDSPIVTMITETIGSPISGFSTITCRISPKAIMKARVIRKQAKKGSWNLTSSHQHAHAPISMNSP